MSNRFDTAAKPMQNGRRKQRIGKEAYDQLMHLTAQKPEHPNMGLGEFVANSTKRQIQWDIMELFEP